MQKALLIIIGILILIGLGGLVYYEVALKPAPAQQGQQNGQGTYNTNPNGYPNTTSVTPNGGTASSTGSGATIKIPMSGNKTVTVKDFIHNGETVADVVNPGFYVLAGALNYCLADGSCPIAYNTDDFTVSYHDTTGQFTITIAKEPLSASRHEAGMFLIDRLGLTPAQACNLNYWVSVPESINAIYSNKNLGFDFCPGATSLQ